MRVEDKDCKACAGSVPCFGGGNKQCLRRVRQNQHIAAIVDTYGGIRTVVGTKRSIRANARHDELCRVVPNLVVHEPIAWNDIPIVIARAKLELDKWLDTRPNLSEVEHECVVYYRLRSLEQPRSSLHLEDVAI